MINRCMELLLDELIAEGVADPLAQPLMLAAIWEDLCRLADEEPPARVRRIISEESGARSLAPATES